MTPRPVQQGGGVELDPCSNSTRTAVSASRESRLRRLPLHEIEMQGAFVVAMRTTARPAGTRIDGVQSSRGSFLGVAHDEALPLKLCVGSTHHGGAPERRMDIA